MSAGSIVRCLWSVAELIVFTVVAECIIARETASKFVFNFYIAIEISLSYSRVGLPGDC